MSVEFRSVPKIKEGDENPDFIGIKGAFGGRYEVQVVNKETGEVLRLGGTDDADADELVAMMANQNPEDGHTITEADFKSGTKEYSLWRRCVAFGEAVMAAAALEPVIDISSIRGMSVLEPLPRADITTCNPASFLTNRNYVVITPADAKDPSAVKA